MECPHCGSGVVSKKGFSYTKHKPVAQRYVCRECKKQFKARFVEDYSDFPKILLMDIETSFYHFVGWGTYKQYIQHHQITKHQYCLSWAAKWLYDKNVQGDIVTPQESIERNDTRVLKSIWNLLDQAEIVIGHNVERFDLRKLNWRFKSQGLAPPTPYKIIDTLKVSRKAFFAPSYKQDFLTKYFKLQNKLETNHKLWEDCEAGIPDALDKMMEYNKHDVIGLEQLYLEIRPFIKNHPNLGILLDDNVCPVCTSTDLETTSAVYMTTAYKYPILRCGNCKTSSIRDRRNSNRLKNNYRMVP